MGPGPHYLYRLFSGDMLVYVGVTRNPLGRFSKHACYKPWWNEVNRVSWVEYQTRRDALLAESIAIRDEGPLYNVARPKVWSE